MDMQMIGETREDTNFGNKGSAMIDSQDVENVKGGQMVPIDGIFGFYELLSGPYVALIFDSKVTYRFISSS